MTQLKLGQSEKRLLKCSVLGALCLITAIGMYYVDPIEVIVQHMLSLYRGSFLFNLWQKPPLEVLVKIYLFNITNSREFLAGIDKKLQLEEIGPYVYQEILEHTDPVFHENGTLSYKPIRHVIPRPELSVGDLENDIIIAPNIPLLGVSSAAYKLSSIASLGFSAFAKSINSQPIINLKVYDYLWGYPDDIIKLASNFLPNWIHFNKFGLLDRLFDDGDNVVTIHLPKYVTDLKEKLMKEEEEKEEANKPIAEKFNSMERTRLMDEFNESFENKKRDKRFIFGLAAPEPTVYEPNIRDYSIDIWNGSPGLEHWGYKATDNTQCNTLRGGYDGTLFPQNISQSEVFYIYRKVFCRTLPVQFSHSGRQYGLEAYWFQLADNAFISDVDDPASSCYCEKGQCLRKGLGNITPCYYNIPAAVSLPHFYKGDPSLQNEVNGLNPSQDKHESEIILQPRLGVPMKANTRFQINLLLGETAFNQAIKPFDDTVLPLMWVELAIDHLPANLEFLLKLLFNIAPYVQYGIIIFIAMLGISLFAVGIIACCFIPKSKLIVKELYPKQDIRYSAINMLPYIKRGLEIYGELKLDDEQIHDSL